jgi:hypothetical protein
MCSLPVLLEGFVDGELEACALTFRLSSLTQPDDATRNEG